MFYNNNNICIYSALVFIVDYYIIKIIILGQLNFRNNNNSSLNCVIALWVDGLDIHIGFFRYIYICTLCSLVYLNLFISNCLFKDENRYQIKSYAVGIHLIQAFGTNNLFCYLIY